MKNLLDGLDQESFVLATCKPLPIRCTDGDSLRRKHNVIRETRLPGRWERVRRAILRPVVERRLIRLGKEEQVAAVVGVYPDLLFLDAAQRAARVLDVPFFPYLHDTVAEAAASSRYARWASNVQKRVFATASRIFVVTGGMAELYRRKYGLDVVALVHIYPERIPPEPPAQPAPRNGLLWAGNAYSINSLSLLRVYGAMRRLGGMRLTMATGQPSQDLEALGFDLKYLNKTYVPVRERPRYLRMIRDHAVLVLALNWPDETHIHEDELATIFPTKTPEYLASGRPIIVHCPGHYHLARFFKEHRCGEVVSERSVEVVEQALRRILDSPEYRATLGRNALKAAKIFSPEKVVPLFGETVEEVLSNR